MWPGLRRQIRLEVWRVGTGISLKTTSRRINNLQMVSASLLGPGQKHRNQQMSRRYSLAKEAQEDNSTLCITMARIWTIFYRIQQSSKFSSRIRAQSSKSSSFNQEDRHLKQSIICCSPNRLSTMSQAEAQTHNKQYPWAAWPWPNSTVSSQHMDWKTLSTARSVRIQEKRISWQTHQAWANRQIWIRKYSHQLRLTKARTWRWTRWMHLKRWARGRVSKQQPPATSILDYVCSSKSSSSRPKTKSCSSKSWTMSAWEWTLKTRRRIKCYNCSTSSRTNSKT